MADARAGHPSLPLSFKALANGGEGEGEGEGRQWEEVEQVVAEVVVAKGPRRGKGRKWSRLWLSLSSQRGGGGGNASALEVYSEMLSSADALNSVVIDVIRIQIQSASSPTRDRSHLLLLLLLGPPRSSSSSSTPAGHPLAAGVRASYPSMAVVMMHFFFRQHRRDDDDDDDDDRRPAAPTPGGRRAVTIDGERDKLRKSLLRRMEEGAAAAGDQRRSPPTPTPTPRRCYSREAVDRFVREGKTSKKTIIEGGSVGRSPSSLPLVLDSGKDPHPEAATKKAQVARVRFWAASDRPDAPDASASLATMDAAAKICSAARRLGSASVSDLASSSAASNSFLPETPQAPAALATSSATRTISAAVMGEEASAASLGKEMARPRSAAELQLVTGLGKPRIFFRRILDRLGRGFLDFDRTFVMGARERKEEAKEEGLDGNGDGDGTAVGGEDAPDGERRAEARGLGMAERRDFAVS
uniref:Uncharacterized protein n=1 Tax=Oryza punctata TaxID=4537 RepID=A0A0E0JS75_ORYPU